MVRPEVAVASDYAILRLKKYIFYYGYEEIEDNEWCFTVEFIDGSTPKIKIPFSKLKAPNQFECQECLLIGIGWVLTKYNLMV